MYKTNVKKEVSVAKVVKDAEENYRNGYFCCEALGLLAKPFYPSIASFTFPFIISAIASKQAMACLTKMGRPIPGLNYAVLIEAVIAVLLMVYVLFGYARFLFFTKQKRR